MQKKISGSTYIVGLRPDGTPCNLFPLHHRMFKSEDDVENGADNQTGGFNTIEAEDCLAAAERFAVSCNDTDLEMLTGLK